MMGLLNWGIHFLGAWGTKSLAVQLTIVASVASVAGAVALSVVVATGISSALDARTQFDSLRTELSSSGLNDFRNEETYDTLAEQFEEAEHLAGRARSRLKVAGLLSWVPVLGSKIDGYQTQLDLAYFLAKAGRGLAESYQDAFGTTGSGEPQTLFTQALENAAPKLAQVEKDLAKVEQIRAEMGGSGLDDSYISVIDTYLPQIQALTYISSRQPGVIGQVYELNLELAAVENLVSDPLQVLSSTDAVDKSLDRIIQRSHDLSAELESLALTIFDSESKGQEAPTGIGQTVNFMAHGANLLEQSAIGVRGLLELTQSADEHGFLTEQFSARALAGLEQAETGLTLAREELRVLDELLIAENKGGNSSGSLLGFGVTTVLSPDSVRNTREILGTAIETTRFLRTFLGFQGRRSYLLLAQNQDEIRATGGFIGAAIRITVDQGNLIEVDFKDSTTVDALPPTYVNNPFPPDPLYWYLWMGKLLFRDANWSPNFPTSADRVADVYRLGQGVQLDGVIAGSKSLLIDLVGVMDDIRVPDLADPLTPAIAKAYSNGDLPYECSDRHVSVRGKRCFDEDAFFAIKDRLTSAGTAQDRGALVEIVRRSLKQRNILVHLFDPRDSGLLWQLGWNGAVPPVDHDYLMVVDSSLPGHTAQGVRRQYEYRVSLNLEGAVNSYLRVRYDHTVDYVENDVCRQSEPSSQSCYWNYFRIFIPGNVTNIVTPPVPLDGGSEKLIWGYPDPDSSSIGRGTEVGPARLMEVGGFIAVPADSVTTIPLEYQQPSKVIRATGENTYEYRLLIQKQPGMDDDRVDVLVEIPAGTEITSTSPSPTRRNGRWLGFNFSLVSDTQVVVSFRVP